MSGPPGRAYVARLSGTAVFDPNGDQVGKVRDVVITLRQPPQPPRVVGLVVEVPMRRRIFVPITRVTSIDAGAVITTGLVNMRRFEQRSGELLVLAELLDRPVSVPDQEGPLVVHDVGIERTRVRDWVVSKVAVARPAKRLRRRRGESRVYDWDQVSGLAAAPSEQGTVALLAAIEEMKAPDVAELIRELPLKRRLEVVRSLPDDRVADVIEELDAADQRVIFDALEAERAADVLEAMGPDDAADLLADLPAAQADALLRLMEPDEAAPVRRLLTYEESSAGGMMTSEPVILPPHATVAEALAHVRNPDLAPSLAAMVYVCRPPLETPTGRFLGVAHIQRLLREPPSSLVSAMLDTDIEPLAPQLSLAEVTRQMARYNLVAAPVVDPAGRLLGAVTVDDVLDHLLGEEWRGRDPGQPEGASRGA